MRFIGLDYGEKRIGVAVSREGIALPKKIILNIKKRAAMTELKKIIREEAAEKIVVGLPLGLDGKDTSQTREVREFARALEKEIKMKVEFENEMLTTKMAEESCVKKELLDASSAAIILQSYLDKKKGYSQ